MAGSTAAGPPVLAVVWGPASLVRLRCHPEAAAVMVAIGHFALLRERLPAAALQVPAKRRGAPCLGAAK